MGCGASSKKGGRYAAAASPKQPGAEAEALAPPAAPSGPPAEALAALLGETLRGKGGEVGTAAALAGRAAVGLYFSAHWCPPCRGFTPALAKAYLGALRAKGMEIVFVSSDRSEADFEGYYKEMPWLALPFASRGLKEALSKKFKVQGIPTLVVLDSEGNVITADGRAKVQADPQGEQFPWRPRPFAEVLGSTFRRGDATVGAEAIAGKTLGIYFSAHWCPPCRGFTPVLAQHYKAYKERGLPFEVVFSTADRDEASFEAYRREMAAAGGDWLSIPWEDSGRRSELDSLFGVSGIPCLVVVDEGGRVVSKNARQAVQGDPTGDAFPWAPPAVGDLAQPEGLNDTPSLCVLMETASAEQRKATLRELESVAGRYAAAARAKGEDPQYLFFSASTAAGPVPRIRSMCDAPSDGASEPTMLLLDIDDNGAFYTAPPAEEKEITAASIQAFLDAYEAKSLERRQLKPPQ